MKAHLSSSERINYSLRPNKHIERNLIFSALRDLQSEFPLEEYRYIGFGSLWFVDLLMAHRVLGIDDLVSIEANLYKRANANRPLACIQVYEGKSTHVIPKSKLVSKRTILWLDYDGPVNASVLSDFTHFMDKAPNGSIILATVNVNPPKERLGIDRVQETLGDLLTKPIEREALRDAVDGFGAVITKALTSHLQEKGTLRISGRYEPLFNFYYSDGASMATIGGMIATDDQKEILTQTGIFGRKGVTGLRPFVVDAPLLTMREKFLLDPLVPADSIKVGDAEAVGVHLSGAQLSAYADLYKHYPLYGEILP